MLLPAQTADGASAPTELHETRDPGGSNPRSAANTWTPEEGGTLYLSLRVDAVPIGGSGIANATH